MATNTSHLLIDFGIQGLSKESSYEAIDTKITDLEHYIQAAQTSLSSLISIPSMSGEVFNVELSMLEERVRKLRYFRNTLSPVSRLSEEVLSEIFLYSCGLDGISTLFGIDNDFDEDGDLIEPNINCHMRIMVAAVSSAWRQTARGNKRLWSTIHSNGELSPEYVSYCYNLSEGHGLCVDLHEPNEEVLRTCLLELRRIRFLQVDFGANDPEKAKPQRRLLNGPEWKLRAPMLQELRLDFVRITDKDIFSGVFPLLQQLTLFKSDFDSNSPLLSSSTMTALCILHPVKRIQCGQLCQILESLPYLVKGHFQECLKPDDETTPPNTSRIYLSKLQELSIAEEKSPELASNLLCSLDLPQASIRTAHSASSTETVMGVIDKFQKDTGRSWGDFQICGIKSLQYLEFCHFSISMSSNITHTFIFNHSASSEFDFVAFSCQNLPLENLQSVSTDDLMEEAVSLLGDLEHLKKLRLIGHSAVKEFIHHMLKKAKGPAAYIDGKPTSSTTTPCAVASFLALEELELVHMKRSSVYKGLFDILAVRKENGMCLRRLSFPKFKLKPEAEDIALAEVVNELTYDRYDRSKPEDMDIDPETDSDTDDDGSQDEGGSDISEDELMEDGYGCNLIISDTDDRISRVS